MRFKTLKIQHQPNDSYEVIVDGAVYFVPDLRSLNELIAEIDCDPGAGAVRDMRGGDEIDEENIL